MKIEFGQLINLWIGKCQFEKHFQELSRIFLDTKIYNVLSYHCNLESQ